MWPLNVVAINPMSFEYLTCVIAYITRFVASIVDLVPRTDLVV